MDSSAEIGSLLGDAPSSPVTEASASLETVEVVSVVSPSDSVTPLVTPFVTFFESELLPELLSLDSCVFASDADESLAANVLSVSETLLLSAVLDSELVGFASVSPVTADSPLKFFDEFSVVDVSLVELPLVLSSADVDSASVEFLVLAFNDPVPPAAPLKR
ncbi:vacuolar sorting protein, putative [Babesia ovata]|uniref:Vacuolar sorting protein, putative n=1 Tax=Babesia ovata TaxID=189622 RepID=A0A2H6KA15_9APIC|nr:vacuolar sorting protein, putative [Babesia ovata]GBE59825.1 vacuolar sorting protein, putative [Babesia ovata]